MRGKRILVVGLAGSFVTFLLCGGIGTCIVVRSWQTLPNATVTVGRDTTFLDGPLDEQGFVDYAAALNGQMAEGVTPENNAAVLLLKAFGPPEGDAEYRREFYRLLHVDPLPAKGDYFVGSDAFLKAKEAEETTAEDADNALNAREKFWQDHEQASTRPWSAEEFPDLARWIDTNATSLELVVEAGRRPKCYLPIVPLDAKEGLISTGNWLTWSLRDSVRLLSVRATLRVSEGRLDEAWEDLLAIHRLARHVSQSPMIVDGLAGVAMETIAVRSQAVLIHYGKPTPGQLTQMLDDFENLPPHRPMGDRLLNGERLVSLDAIVNLSRNLASELEKTDVLRDSEIGRKVLTFASRSAFDWDEILRTTNRNYDDLEKALDNPSLRERLAAVEALQAAREAELEESHGVGRMLRSFISFRSPKTTLSKHIGNILAALLLPSSEAALESDARGIANRRMMKIALGVARHRAELGAYPDSLAVVSDYLPDVPVDPFSEQPFRYRLEGEGFLIYSVGPNGLDEEGRNDAEAGGCLNPQADDITLHVPPVPPTENGSQ